MNYQFTIDKFQGPLDLLLHLIKESDIDIFDIDVSNITSQYLNYIESMESLNLNIDSEYLVMAAELIEMKSRELLPNMEIDEDEYEEDPRENLINRLVEYQRYKDLALEFKDMEKVRKLMFSKEPSDLNQFKNEKAIISDNILIDDLIKAFMDFQTKQEYNKPLNTVVTRKEYSVHMRSTNIMKKLKVHGTLKFSDLFEIKSRDYIVVTFLAILNLAKEGNLQIKQDKNLDEIVLSIKGEV